MTAAADPARTDETRAKLAEALATSGAVRPWGTEWSEIADALLPVVRQIVADELRTVADEVPGLIPSTPAYLRARADAWSPR